MTFPGVKSGRCRSLKVFRPISVLAKRSSMYTFMPCTMDTTAIRNITPISTPMSEKKLLSFWARIAPIAIRIASISRI